MNPNENLKGRPISPPSSKHASQEETTEPEDGDIKQEMAEDSSADNAAQDKVEDPSNENSVEDVTQNPCGQKTVKSNNGAVETLNLNHDKNQLKIPAGDVEQTQLENTIETEDSNRAFHRQDELDNSHSHEHAQYQASQSTFQGIFDDLIVRSTRQNQRNLSSNNEMQGDYLTVALTQAIDYVQQQIELREELLESLTEEISTEYNPPKE